MTPRYRHLPTTLWRDARLSGLDDPEKLLALYALTGPQTNRIGLYVFSCGLAAEDLGWASERSQERFAKVVETMNWEYDKGSRVLLITDWWAWNRPPNPNVFLSCLGDLRDIPQTPLLQRFCDNASNLPETFTQLLRNVPANVSPNCPPQETVAGTRNQEPPSTVPAAAAAAWEEGEVAALVTELKQLGVYAASAAIAAAQDKGFSPQVVRQRVDEFKAKLGAYNSGQLKSIVSGDIDAWPPENPKWQKLQRRRADDERAALEKADRHQRAAAKAIEDAALAALKPALAALSETERELLLQEAVPNEAERRQYHGRPGLAEPVLLTALRGRQVLSEAAQPA